MRALIAPDKFRGTATALEAAEALAAGVADAVCRAVVAPLADGGEGTLAALAEDAGVPWAAVVGQALVYPPGGRVVDLVATFGRDRAKGHTSACLRAAARDYVLTGADLARSRPV